MDRHFSNTNTNDTKLKYRNNLIPEDVEVLPYTHRKAKIIRFQYKCMMNDKNLSIHVL